MKLLPIGVGILFLLNPMIGIYDILPDFIGCLLLIIGIGNGSYIIEKLGSAKRWFLYGLLISAVKFALSFADIESVHTLPLTLTFTFSIIEIIVYIPAFRSFFSGFDYATMRLGGSEILSIGKKNGYYTDEHGVRQFGEINVDVTGKLCTASQIFIVIRSVGAMLPELPALQLSESEGLGSVTAFQFSSVETLISLASVIAVLIPAVILFVKYVVLLKKVGRSGDFLPALDAEFKKCFGDPSEIHTCTGMKLLSLLGGTALLLYMGLYDYQINIVPRYFSAAVLCVATLVLFVFSRRSTACLIPLFPAAAVIPLSFKVYALQNEHYGLFKRQMLALLESGSEYVDAVNINTIDSEYLTMATAEALEALLLGSASVLFVFLYYRVCLNHLKSFGSVPERYRGDIAASLKKRGLLMLGCTTLSTLYFTAYRFILPYFNAASILGIAVNTVSVGAFAFFAVFANRNIYGNLY